jgi:hypothetical protein
LDEEGNDEMEPFAVHRSPDIYIIARENLGKPQLGDSLKAVQVISSNGVTF